MKEIEREIKEIEKIEEEISLDIEISEEPPKKQIEYYECDNNYNCFDSLTTTDQRIVKNNL